MSQRRILILGAGLVSRPAFHYFVTSPGYRVTLADRDLDVAKATAGAHADRAVELDLTDTKALDALVADADAVISLVPYTFHATVAEACLRHRVHMVTTSYVQPGIAELDAKARGAGVVLLNEVGLAPGIDHMTAMDLIDHVRDRGGHIESLVTTTGGLPAPEHNDNPWGYKFSWSPRGVLLAAMNDARYLREGKEITLPAKRLFHHHWPTKLDGIGRLEVYANRDAVKYVDLYGLQEVHSIFRGSLRYPGWSRTMDALGRLGLLDDTLQRWPEKATYGDLMARLLGTDVAECLAICAAERLDVDVDDPVIQRLEYAGLMSDRPLEATEASPLDLLATRLERALAYREGQRDMVVMRHTATSWVDEEHEVATVQLTSFGIPGGDSAMSRLVGLPAAIATRLVADGRITTPGVLRPLDRSIYRPILEELEFLGVHINRWARPAFP